MGHTFDRAQESSHPTRLGVHSRTSWSCLEVLTQPGQWISCFSPCIRRKILLWCMLHSSTAVKQTPSWDMSQPNSITSIGVCRRRSKMNWLRWKHTWNLLWMDLAVQIKLHLQEQHGLPEKGVKVNKLFWAWWRGHTHSCPKYPSHPQTLMEAPSTVGPISVSQGRTTHSPCWLPYWTLELCVIS